MYKYYDKKNNFVETFNPETGFYIRSDDLTTGKEPFMRDFPALLDIGIMGHCVHGASGLCIQSGVQCYQNGLHTQEPNMSLESFKRIVDECKGKTFQFALGGRGDVDQHEDFEEILKYCRSQGIVPNFTSSGLGFNEKIVSLCKEYCGAVAISWYRNEYTGKAIDMLVSAGVTTNIHYVLGRNSIDEAIEHLQQEDFPDGINAVIFLLHKPVGLGTQTNVLSPDDERVKEFFSLIDKHDYKFQIGFDSCSVPGLLNFTEEILNSTLEPCEGARFSGYITSDMKMLPCSFDNQELKWAVDLNEHTIQEAWDSDVFDDFRSHFRNSCRGCSRQCDCLGGCPIRREIVLCTKEEKDLC